MHGRLAMVLKYLGAFFLMVMAAVGGIEFAHRQEFISSSSTDFLATLLIALTGAAGIAAIGEIDENNKTHKELIKYQNRAEQLEDIVRGLSSEKKLPLEYAKAWDRIGPLVQIHRF